MPVTIKKIAATPSTPSAVEAGSKFSCMLAASEIPTEDQIKFPVYASYKLDGIRSPILNSTAMSRKMLPLPNRYLQKWVGDHGQYLQGLDGEMIVGEPNLTTTFNTTTSGVMSSDGEPDFRFYVFEHWNMGTCVAKDRHEFLSKYITALPFVVKQRIVLVHQQLIYNMEELKAYYKEALDLGYEGLILKSPHAAYKFGRSTILGGQAMKWKEFIDYNCVIREVKQGKTNTNEKKLDELGRAKRSTAKAGKVPIEEVGGFLVECIEPESVYFGMRFNCGPGFLTQEELKALWLTRASLIGRPMRVKSQKLGGKTLPRFPSFFGWIDPINMGDVA